MHTELHTELHTAGDTKTGCCAPALNRSFGLFFHTRKKEALYCYSSLY